MDSIEQLITLTNQYYQRGWTPSASSNFSIKDHANMVWITQSGRHKGTLTEQDFMKVSITGEPMNAGTPSAETGLHLMLYSKQPTTGAVLHTHSPKATVLSMIQSSNTLTFVDYEILKAFPNTASHETEKSLRIYDNSQDIPALVEQITADLPIMEFPAFLIKGHGIYAWGNTLADADRHLEAIEYLINCEILRRQLTS